MEACIPVGTPVRLKEMESAEQSDGSIISSHAATSRDIGFICETTKVGFDDGMGGGRTWKYNIVTPNKGVVRGLRDYQFEVTEFEGPEFPELKEARDVRIGDVLKNEAGVKFVVVDIGTMDTYRVDSDTKLYFRGFTPGEEFTTVRNVPLRKEIEVYEK